MSKKRPTKKRSAIPRGGNDRVMTPDSLALAIVKHFKPLGNACEPCCGEGAFTKALEEGSSVTFIVEYEITEGSDFLLQPTMPPDDCFDWIITNPPWSKFLAFLKQAMGMSNNVVFLANANAWFVKARINAMREASFHFREFAYVPTPKKPWPQFGLQLAAVHISRTPGDCVFSDLDWTPETPCQPGE